jgi:hypothetical protein
MFPEQMKATRCVTEVDGASGSAMLKLHAPHVRRNGGKMLDEARLKYDSGTKALRYRSGLRGPALLSREEGVALSRIARAGTWNGNAVAEVVVEFGDQAAAVHNADALAFLRIAAEGPQGRAVSSARFSVREDFGIPPSGGKNS